MSDPRWVAVYAKAKQEQRAAMALAEQGFETFLPQAPKRDARGMMTSMAPMFPRYLFCGVWPDQSVAPIRSTPGVSSMVRFGGTVAFMQQRDIDAISAVEQLMTGNDPLRPGEAIEILSGPFAGLNALVDASAEQRIYVLLEFMGKMNRVALAPEQVARAG